MTVRVARVALVLGVALSLHLTLLSQLRLQGVRPDAMLLVAVCAGVVAGPERGAVAGFWAGLLADLFLQSPFGLSSLSYCLVGYGVGLLQSGILRSTWWIPLLTAFAASAAGIVAFAVLAAMVGQVDVVTPRLAVVAVVVGLMNAALAPAALRAASWSFRSGPPDRPAL